VKGYELDGQGLIPGRDEIFLNSTASRLALGYTQSPIQWVLGLLSRGVKWLAKVSTFIRCVMSFGRARHRIYKRLKHGGSQA
jgi:hypothetical protein